MVVKMLKFKDLEELNNAGYLTVAQTNALLESKKSALRARTGIEMADKGIGLLFFPSPGEPYLIMPGITFQKTIYQHPETVLIKSLDIEERIFVFKETEIERLAEEYPIDKASDRTRLELS